VSTKCWPQIDRGLRKNSKHARSRSRVLSPTPRHAVQHSQSDNSCSYFAAKLTARPIFGMLPRNVWGLRNRLKRAVNRLRVKKLGRQKASNTRSNVDRPAEATPSGSTTICANTKYVPKRYLQNICPQRRRFFEAVSRTWHTRISQAGCGG